MANSGQKNAGMVSPHFCGNTTTISSLATLVLPAHEKIGHNADDAAEDDDDQPERFVAAGHAPLRQIQVVNEDLHDPNVDEQKEEHQRHNQQRWGRDADVIEYAHIVSSEIPPTGSRRG